MKKTAITLLCFAGLALAQASVHAQIEQEADVRKFVGEMVSRHGFKESQLLSMFSQAQVSTTILEAISRPAEAKPWYKYRPIFIQDERIRLGREFLVQHRVILDRAEQQFGVPREIIAAIIGVETRYGKNTGSYKVIDSLVTLGFKYPKRGEFFRSELEQFLLLTREQQLDPHSLKGSYAGAMGIPQFISSSYRNFAVDFDGDKHIDIWNNPADAIGSVANYFSEHGWVSGEEIAVRADVSGDRYLMLINKDLKPELTLAQMAEYGVSTPPDRKPEMPAKLLSYELENGVELWLGFTNFYVITRYNHSPLYAMAVFQLAGEIAAGQGDPVAQVQE
jgi:membrane-bound lytic murein transglycosylase B